MSLALRLLVCIGNVRLRLGLFLGALLIFLSLCSLLLLFLLSLSCFLFQLLVVGVQELGLVCRLPSCPLLRFRHKRVVFGQGLCLRARKTFCCVSLHKTVLFLISRNVRIGGRIKIRVCVAERNCRGHCSAYHKELIAHILFFCELLVLFIFLKEVLGLLSLAILLTILNEIAGISVYYRHSDRIGGEVVLCIVIEVLVLLYVSGEYRHFVIFSRSQVVATGNSLEAASARLEFRYTSLWRLLGGLLLSAGTVLRGITRVTVTDKLRSFSRSVVLRCRGLGSYRYLFIVEYVVFCHL